MSTLVSAMADISRVTASVVESVLAEDKLSKDISLVPCASLTALHLQVATNPCPGPPRPLWARVILLVLPCLVTKAGTVLEANHLLAYHQLCRLMTHFVDSIA